MTAQDSTDEILSEIEKSIDNIKNLMEDKTIRSRLRSKLAKNRST
jgi:hypothetical protein